MTTTPSPTRIRGLAKVDLCAGLHDRGRIEKQRRSDRSAVRRAEISDLDSGSRPPEFKVKPRNGRVVDDDIVFLRASHRTCRRLGLEVLPSPRAR